MRKPRLLDVKKTAKVSMVRVMLRFRPWSEPKPVCCYFTQSPNLNLKEP